MVMLIYPPSVSSSIGQYYPASAVLAAYLDAFGFQCQQIDLNAEFALFFCRALSGVGGVNELTSSSVGPEMALIRKYAHRFGPQDAGLLHSWRSTRLWPILLHALRKFERQAVPPSMMAHFLDCGAGLLDKVLNRIKTGDLVGFTMAMGTQVAPTQALSSYVKAKRPDVRIVVGGPAISLMDDEACRCLLADGSIDLAVRYEGEGPLLELARQVEFGRWEPDAVPNAVFLDNGRLKVNAPHSEVRITTLPPPLYDAEIVQQQRVSNLSVIQARGCYWGRCAYCDYVNLYADGRRYRTTSSSKIVDDIVRLTELHGIKHFTLITEAIPPAFANRFAEALIADHLGVTWTSFAMVHEGFTEDLMRKMAASGCVGLVVGLESMNDAALKLVNKYADSAMNAEFVRIARAAGIQLQINLIPDLPGTEPEAALRDLPLFGSWSEDPGIAIEVFEFEVTKSSEIGRRPEDFGLTATSGDDADATGGQAEFAQNHMEFRDSRLPDVARSMFIDSYKGLHRTPHPKSDDVTNPAGAPLWVDVESEVWIYSPRHAKLLVRPIPWKIVLMIIEDNSLDLDELSRSSWFYKQVVDDLEAMGCLTTSR